MDQNRFDALTLLLSDVVSRRRVLRGVAAAGPVLAATRRHEFAHANKKRINSPKKQKPNAFGCLNVGVACKNPGQCCSGLCQGKKGRRRCRAHDTGNCLAGEHPGECLGANVACITSLGKQGTCATTTGNAAYCTSSFIECFDCKTDADCQAVDGGALGPRAACIRCADCAEINGTACAALDVPQTM